MSDDQSDLRQREAELIAELTRLRTLLEQAGVDAQHSSNEATATELRHSHEMEAERTETRAARAEADEGYRTGPRAPSCSSKKAGLVEVV